MTEDVEGGIPPSAAPPSSGRRRRKTILLVDDQPDEREIQRAMLEHLGYAVTEAEDGWAALELARRSTPDLVLLDIAMPRIDGLEVCRELRTDERTSQSRVLFYTASTADDVLERVRTAGGDGVLIKPVDPHEVAEQVRLLIGLPHE
ncbi:MAG: response regulator [Gemmatimonadota bacterium]